MLLGSIFSALSGVDWKLIAGWSKLVNPNFQRQKSHRHKYEVALHEKIWTFLLYKTIPNTKKAGINIPCKLIR
jgi:hypothetical protein